MLLVFVMRCVLQVGDADLISHCLLLTDMVESVGVQKRVWYELHRHIQWPPFVPPEQYHQQIDAHHSIHEVNKI